MKFPTQHKKGRQEQHSKEEGLRHAGVALQSDPSAFNIKKIQIVVHLYRDLAFRGQALTGAGPLLTTETGMVRKRTPRAVSSRTTGITADRFARLHRLLQLIGSGPQTRTLLLRRLRTDVRGFYRDLELLRKAGITVTLDGQRYRLTGELADALALLPFPDPHLLYGDLLLLIEGKTPAHRKLRKRVDELTP
jgi:hypothetical protein